jgi:hypothetical protein
MNRRRATMISCVAEAIRALDGAIWPRCSAPRLLAESADEVIE